jgi:hypothetical protein
MERLSDSQILTCTPTSIYQEAEVETGTGTASPAISILSPLDMADTPLQASLKLKTLSRKSSKLKLYLDVMLSSRAHTWLP